MIAKTFCSWINDGDKIFTENKALYASCVQECVSLVKPLNMPSLLQLTGLILSCDSDVTRLIEVDWAVRLVVKPLM